MLSSIVGLEHLKFDVNGNWEVQFLLEGLMKHSTSSLRSLSIKMISCFQTAKCFADLSSFSSLEIIESDGNLIDLLVDSLQKLPTIKNSHKDASKKQLPQVLPPSLSSWRVFPNWSSDNVITKNGYPSGFELTRSIRSVTLPASFRSVSLFKRISSDGAVRNPAISDEASEKELKNTCLEFRIEFQILEAHEATSF